jgi:regulator of PEP synthase PpsR (kinase-PPPase family)
MSAPPFYFNGDLVKGSQEGAEEGLPAPEPVDRERDEHDKEEQRAEDEVRPGRELDADRLAQIRNERRPDSRYAANDQVRFEVRSAEALFSENGIPCINTTHMSIEEIATTIMHTTGLKRRTF